MAINNFSTDLFTVNVNGTPINDWGVTDPPYSEEPINPRSTLQLALGGNALRLDRINPGRRVTLNLNPGGSDAGFLQGLMNAGTTITLGKIQVGTGEAAFGSEGTIVNDGTVGRGGSSVTDNVFIIEFNIWTATK